MAGQHCLGGVDVLLEGAPPLDVARPGTGPCCVPDAMPEVAVESAVRAYTLRTPARQTRVPKIDALVVHGL